MTGSGARSLQRAPTGHLLTSGLGPQESCRVPACVGWRMFARTKHWPVVVVVVVDVAGCGAGELCEWPAPEHARRCYCAHTGHWLVTRSSSRPCIVGRPADDCWCPLSSHVGSSGAWVPPVCWAGTSSRQQQQQQQHRSSRRRQREHNEATTANNSLEIYCCCSSCPAEASLTPDERLEARGLHSRF